MADGIAAALAGPATTTASQEGNTSSFIPTPPSSLSQIPAWGLGIGMGEALSESFLEKYPELAASEEDKEKVKSLMRGMMNEVTRTLGKSLDYLKELDDDEEKCAAATLYG